MSKFLIEIIEKNQARLLKNIPKFERFCASGVDWDFPLVGLIGSRGVGKTTIMLQQLKNRSEGAYFSCDNIDVQSVGLYQLVYSLVNEYGKRHIFVDEIHKYPNWIQEIKNCTDSFPDIKIVISGSSGVDILKSGYDLSRRLLVYDIPTVSFREFLAFKYNLELPSVTLIDLVKNHQRIAVKYAASLNQNYLWEYLKEYSYFYRATVRDSEEYYLLLENAVKKIIYEDIARLFSLPAKNLPLLERMLILFSAMTPSDMTYAKIGKKIGLDAKTIEYYTEILEMVGLLNIIKRHDSLTNHLVKEKKFLLDNVNLIEVFKRKFTDLNEPGLSREVFFVNSLRRVKDMYVSLDTTYDFFVKYKDDSFVFEIGGKDKKLKNQKHKAIIVSDEILVGQDGKIPLWMFGLI